MVDYLAAEWLGHSVVHPAVHCRVAQLDLADPCIQRRGVQCHGPGGTDADHANTANTFTTDLIEVVDDRQQIADA
ncbi:MAG: hypothetical protein HON54_00870, partial [Verrucomicrobia bacterium]|nr:hypothetical protein [Verrucomicrobiota bacterium]